jgi:hypothetical protein
VARGDAGGVFVRFKLEEPNGARWHVLLGGFVHKPNWRLPRAELPRGSRKKGGPRLESGQFTKWFDLKAWAGKSLHGRMKRSGGVAEFPNVTAQFMVEPPSETRRVVIELATASDAKSVVRRFEETFAGDLTSFLVSPNLKADAAELETAAQMTGRRLRWAIAASAAERASPKHHIIQTSFWSPQRPELNLKEAKVLWLLGFNVVGNQTAEVSAAFPDLRVPGHTHRVTFGPAATREGIDALMKKHAEAHVKKRGGGEFGGAPFGLADEICARPRIEANAQALAHLHAWLAERKIDPKALGVEKLADVVPLETPEALREAQKVNDAAARRVFYYTSRFRQLGGTQRIRWHTEAFHRHFPPGAVTSTLVADHPYFGGTGLGMGMKPNSTWGGAPLALDWFDLARRRAVDMIGVEDWMGLQFMYGPNATWEGFQLMGFQAAIMRSGGRGDVPIIAWITPSDETNLRLKSHSALCQGAKHFFYWTYGPTATSTENYWSDLRSAYDGVVRVTRQLAAAEEVLHPARHRKTRVALLYSLSSDLWQPFDYIHMLERRATYFALVHDQYLVDMLTEEDVEAGRLDDYAILYATDPCITAKATAAIRAWVRRGGHLYGSCGAGTMNEFGEPVTGLADVFGIAPHPRAEAQPGRYRFRGGLNRMEHLDRLRVHGAAGLPQVEFGVIGVREALEVKGGMVVGSLGGGPGVVTNMFGRGGTVRFAVTPGVSYIKDAKFVPAELKEKWPEQHRSAITRWCRLARAQPQVELSHPVVEAGVYDGDAGTALVLANFTYEPIEELAVCLPAKRPPARVHLASAPDTPLAFHVRGARDEHRAAGFEHEVVFTMKLGLDEIVLVK